MKKLLIINLLLVFPLLAGQGLKSNIHSLNLSPLTMNYSYEYSYSKEGKILSKLGLLFGGTTVVVNTDELQWGLTPKIGLEGRYYYNLMERKNKQKNIQGNSANYLALGANYCFDKVIIGNSDDINFDRYYSLETKWGLKRSIFKNLFYEFNIGAGVYFMESEDWKPQLGPAGTIKLGWRF